MNVIHRFDNVDHINSYMNDRINNFPFVQLTADNIQQYAETYSMNPSLIHDVQNTTDTSFYIYIGSKTTYRKTVHSFIPNVLYKRMYNSFKLNGYIREANGTHVIIHLKPVTQDVYDDITITSDLDNQKVLNQLIDNFSNVSADNQYYIDYIKSLEQRCQELAAENENLKSQIFSAKISTWY